MSMSAFTSLDQNSVNTMRFLAADMVEKAKSGHPGLPLGAAPMAYVLLTRFLKHNPKEPLWADRDRFILSAGHGSALLYAWLHLGGYGLSMDELKKFRQYGSLTPGHPEYGHTPGVEATTGPLGHGFAMGVGMAMAEKALAARFNKPEFTLFNHRVYGLVSDGDLMEGVASEAASLAGTLSLGKLIYLYDDNQITIEGRTDLAFTEDVRERFLAYGWQVIVVAQGDDLGSIYQALENARLETEKPSLVVIKTKIGAGSSKEDTPAAHGEPLGTEAIKAFRKFYGRAEDVEFTVEDEVYGHFKGLSAPGQAAYEAWCLQLDAYAQAYPEEAAELTRRLKGELPQGWNNDLPAFEKGKKIATRSASGQVMNALASSLPELIGGSADLGPSNKTNLNGYDSFNALQPEGRNLHFGIREAAAGAIVNGLAINGGFIPFGATFLVFSDFMRPAVRLAALMKARAVFVFTHDSIGVGEDGPTHQPVEHLISLRAIPGLVTIRPADAYETVAAWQVAVFRQGPTALALSRQDLPVLHPDDFPNVVEGPFKGAYILSEAPGGSPEALIVATGSEVSLALEAQTLLNERGRKVRVVSMPSWELFEEQSQEYKNKVLPPSVSKRLSVEAGRSLGWERYVGNGGRSLAVDTFGLSAPAAKVFEELGFTVSNIVKIVESL